MKNCRLVPAVFVVAEYLYILNQIVIFLIESAIFQIYNILKAGG